MAKNDRFVQNANYSLNLSIFDIWEFRFETA